MNDCKHFLNSHYSQFLPECNFGSYCSAKISDHKFSLAISIL